MNIWGYLFNFYYDDDLNKLKTIVDLSVEMSDHVMADLMITKDSEEPILDIHSFVNTSMNGFITNNKKKIIPFVNKKNEIDFLLKLTTDMITIYAVVDEDFSIDKKDIN